MLDVAAYLASKGYRGRPASGGRELTYPCFFDCAEPTDSRKKKLYVNVEEAVYSCKVCGASGGSYTLQKHFGDDPKSGTSDDAFTRRRILDWASDVGAEMLANRDEALLYLINERGLDPQTIVDRKLGFVGDGWSLTGSLPAEFSREQLKQTGLVYKDGARGGDDFFRQHILIPIISRGHVVSIRGRMWGEGRGGKYMSGPGEAVRAYNTDSLEDAEEVILTEGEFDAIRLYEVLQASSEERVKKIAVVGLPGTNAFPEDLDDLLSEIKRIFIGFDSDEPGRIAAEKLRERYGARARVLQLPSLDGRKCDWTEFLLPKQDGRGWELEHPYAGHSGRDVLRLMSAASGKRIHSVAEAGAAFREYRSTNSGLQTGWHELDAVIHPGLLPGQVVFLLAKTGCLAGDTEININRQGKGIRMRLDEFVERQNGRLGRWDLAIPTYIQRHEDGVVRKALVTQAWASGEKETFTVTTVTGRAIRATAEHPFSTAGGWKPLGQLVVGDELHVNVGRSEVGRTAKDYRRTVVRRHPYAGRRGVAGAGGWTVPTHRLVVEADMNGMTFAQYVDLLRDSTSDLTGLEFIDPEKYAVHHVDHDSYNNELSNLELLTHAAHAERHAAEGTFRNVLEQVGTETVVGIEAHGVEPTYDIEVEGDPNYLANGFVVHNTGKTLLLCNLAYQMRKRRILFISLEMTREEVYHRLERVYLFHHPTATIDELEYALGNVWICDENRIGEKDIQALVSEYQVETGERPDVIFVDYLGYYARGAKGGSPYEKVTNAAMQLKADAKAGRLVIISPTQVSRVAKDGKPIDLDDARDSGAIEETGDFVLAAFRPDNALASDGVLNARPTFKVKLSVLKSRHGGVGKVISLQMDALTLAIVEDGTSAASKAEAHNMLHWRGKTWENLRAEETRPRQLSMPTGAS